MLGRILGSLLGKPIKNPARDVTSVSRSIDKRSSRQADERSRRETSTSQTRLYFAATQAMQGAISSRDFERARESPF